MADWFGKEDFKLGFGLMRLPKNADGSIDIPQVSEMVDRFLEAGGTYFDTAYVYEGSEEAVRKALVDRWPRERYTLATKLNAWLGRPDEQSAKKQLETSLQRTGAGYFDYYLLHSLQLNNRETYDSYGLWDFVREQKEKGRIRHWGFSFHSTPELLDELLTEHAQLCGLEHAGGLRSKALGDCAQTRKIHCGHGAGAGRQPGKSAGESGGAAPKSESGRLSGVLGHPLCGISGGNPDRSQWNVHNRSDGGQSLLYAGVQTAG